MVLLDKNGCGTVAHPAEESLHIVFFTRPEVGELSGGQKQAVAIALRSIQSTAPLWKSHDHLSVVNRIR